MNYGIHSATIPNDILRAGFFSALHSFLIILYNISAVIYAQSFLLYSHIPYTMYEESMAVCSFFLPFLQRFHSKCDPRNGKKSCIKNSKRKKNEMKTMNTMNNKNYVTSEKRMCFVYENWKVEKVDGKEKEKINNRQTNLCSWNNANGKKEPDDRRWGKEWRRIFHSSFFIL